ncbi:MAG: YqgE/AlgH family protein [Bacteroidaceae bacterium]|nr:YqgE/AlgH family protein [Bacteroidaceae bacterium]
MKTNTDIFKIQTNNVAPALGKILISGPFLFEPIFRRSVILLIDHSKKGSMGIVVNKKLPLCLNDFFKEFDVIDNIPLYKGGPVETNMLFYIHRLEFIPDSLSLNNGLYVNGNFDYIKSYILKGNPVSGYIRFFLGYCGWSDKQMSDELKKNTWMVSETNAYELLEEKENLNLWKHSMESLGSKYRTWARFPLIPSLN